MARVRYVTREALPESQRHIYDEIAGARGHKEVGNVFEALLNSPEAASRVAALGAYLRFQSELPATTLELVIITVASELGCDYERVHHERLAHKAGVSDATITSIRAGRTDRLSPYEAAVLCYARELIRHHRVTQEVFEAALSQVGTSGMINLTLLVGYYAMVALALLALDVELEKGVDIGRAK